VFDGAPHNTPGTAVSYRCWRVDQNALPRGRPAVARSALLGDYLDAEPNAIAADRYPWSSYDVLNLA
jgi:hypothetical protein